jgi:hypothetical protein
LIGGAELELEELTISEFAKAGPPAAMVIAYGAIEAFISLAHCSCWSPDYPVSFLVAERIVVGVDRPIGLPDEFQLFSSRVCALFNRLRRERQV